MVDRRTSSAGAAGVELDRIKDFLERRIINGQVPDDGNHTDLGICNEPLSALNLLTRRIIISGETETTSYPSAATIETQLNTRPRQVLNDRSPAEVFTALVAS